MAKNGVRLKRRRNRRRDAVGLPWGLASGVLIILLGAVLAWNFRATLTTALGGGTEASSAGKGQAREKTPKGSSQPAARSAQEQQAATEAADRFEFYDMLPDAEVDVAAEPERPKTAAPPLVLVPGTYVVQAGAFPDFAAADRVKARLALLGIVAEIQVAEAGGSRFHRVRIGPIENLDQLNRLRARLRQNGIDHQVIPIGE